MLNGFGDAAEIERIRSAMRRARGVSGLFSRRHVEAAADRRDDNDGKFAARFG
jgi:hypothetical protein